ncbi:hypothetical protein EBAPG3_010970 [Nitrosospira lacus]|uniref:Uncharacterized protein n=1 Tax=Nitrosospira lacus TaxID=1288494 RepID=A0A1W6SR42_9PROT|nr:hypothetical protein [Nitrosospira lacus]ARO88259.1 hypothetical protein EBAPG3_010970 [Nitrosospira lacus]
MTTETPDNDQENERTRADANERAKIGKNIVYFALSVIGILGFVSILAASFGTAGEKSFTQVKDILGILLPVLGTWVGTVLAFYFSKENFIAAAQQTSNLVRQLTPDQKLQAIPVEEAMISITAPTTVKLTLNKKEEEIKLKADILDALLPEGGKNRLPCVDPEGKIKYVIHRSIIEGYISKQAFSGSVNLADLTLKDMLAVNQIQRIATAFGAVGQNAKLNAVKTLMDGNPECSDVFVTVDGTKNGNAVGWITNIILTEKCKV